MMLKGIMYRLYRFLSGTKKKTGPAVTGRGILDGERGLPRHVAIIMDGNGRWAVKRGLPRLAGHRRGADKVRDIVDFAANMGIEYLTLYTFSTENWKRPDDEVDGLMNLLVNTFDRYIGELVEKNVKVMVIGRREGLSEEVLRTIERAESLTRNNTGIRLIFAINYGGRSEISDGCRRIAAQVRDGVLDVEDIDEELVAGHLYTAGIPDPDLLIRTGGEMRISNFMLWQLAYTEIVVFETLWPDFDGDDLLAAVREYQRRERRYGGLRS